MKNSGRSKRGPRRDVGKERVWRRHVRRQARSKLSVREYCASAGISEPSFYAWRRELVRRNAKVASSSAQVPGSGKAIALPSGSGGRRPLRAETHPSIPLRPQFLPITISPPSSHSIEAVLASGLVLRVPAHDAVALRTVLDVVEGRAC